eukprot:3760326-Amphidinium_carterae.1
MHDATLVPATRKWQKGCPHRFLGLPPYGSGADSKQSYYKLLQKTEADTETSAPPPHTSFKHL